MNNGRQRDAMTKTSMLLFKLGAIAIFQLASFCEGAQEPSKSLKDSYEARREWVLNLFRDHTIRHQPKTGSPEVPVRLYLTDGNDPDALEYITRVFQDMAERKAPDQVRNAAPALVRTLYMFGDHFSSDQIRRIKDAVTGEVVSARLYSHGTENHAAQFVVSLYLLAQYFPDAVWNVSKKEQYTSRQIIDITRKRILQRGRGFYNSGNAEMLSTTYDIVSSYPFLNLMEFARDPVMRDAGEALVLYHVSLQALNNFDGHIMPPFNRRNTLQVRFGPPEKPTGRYLPMHLQAAWLWWGQNEITPADFVSSGEPQYTLDYALAKWRMPEPLNRIARGANVPFEIHGAVGRFGGSWGENPGQPETLRYVWKDRDFAIGGPVAQHIKPAGFLLNYELFSIAWKSTDRLRSLEAMHPYWYSNEGEDSWHTTHSPFQQAGLYRNTAIIMYNIPDKDPWPDRADQKQWLNSRDKHFGNLIKLGQVRFPKTIDELVKEGDLYFFREGSVYVSVRVLKSGHTLQEIEDQWMKGQSGMFDPFYVIKSHEAQTGFVMEAGTAEDHGSFKAFQEKIKANALSVDWNQLEVRYTTSKGDQLRFRYDPDMSEDKEGYIWFAPEFWINNEKRVTANWPLAGSPVMSLLGGILKVDQGGDGFCVDWSGALPVIKRH